MKKFKNYFGLIAVACAVCFSMTACGSDKNGSTSGNNDNTQNDSVAENVGDAVEDVADGVGNAVDDLVGDGGFNNYADAHDYFMDTMGSYHSDATFELRDEDKNLSDYQEGSKGYRFNLYDTSKNDKGDLFGEFYVDATSGAIYKRGDDGSINEYPGGMNSANKSTSNSSNKTTSNTKNKTTSHNNTSKSNSNSMMRGER